MTDQSPDTFPRHFAHAERRFRWRAALRAAATALPWLQGAWVVLFVLRRLELVNLSLEALAAGFAATLALTVIWGTARSPTGRDAALVLDQRLATRELLTTAHESEVAHPLARLARQRAATALDATAVARAVPLTRWRAWRPALAGAALLVAAFFLPLPAPSAAAALAVDPAVEAAAQEMTEEIAPLLEEIAELDRPAAEEALARLQEIAEEMRSGELKTPEDALVALAEMEEQLSAVGEEAEAADEFDEIVRGLGAEPMASDLAVAMSEGDREALRRALERMAEAVDSAEARDAAVREQLSQLGARLAKLADRLAQRGEDELAEALAELAEALAKGDTERASELLKSEKVGAACKLGGRLSKGSNMDQKLNEIAQLARLLLGEYQPPKSTKRSGSGRKSGPMAGTGSTNEEAESYETGDPRLRDRQSDDTGEEVGSFEALYDSRLTGVEGFEDLKTGGRVSEEGELLAEPGRALGFDSGGSLPLQPFSGAAAGASERAVDLESVPLGYRELVRDYFDRGTRPKTKKGDGE